MGSSPDARIDSSAVPERASSSSLRTELEATLTIWARDMLRFSREPSRVVGSLAQPLLFWLVIGTGIGSTFQPRSFPEEFSYLGFFYPGIIGLTLLFTSIFSTISVISDREHGFLREILVSPASRGSIVMGKILAGTTLAVAQGSLLVLLAPLAGLTLSLGAFLQILVIMTAVSMGLTALGFTFAWRMNSVQGFHVVMNFLLFPMWLLSGAMFPLHGVPGLMRSLMYLNPLTYGIDAMRGLLAPPGQLPPGFVQLPPLLSLCMAVAFTVVLILLALRACRAPTG